MAGRELVNLGGGWFGHEVTYQKRPDRRVVLAVGVDPVDQLEDLDFASRTRTIAGEPVDVFTTAVQPLRIAELADPLPSSCGSVFVLTERLTSAEFAHVVAGIKLRVVDKRSYS